MRPGNACANNDDGADEVTPQNILDVINESSFGNEAAQELRGRALDHIIDSIVDRVTGTGGRSPVSVSDSAFISEMANADGLSVSTTSDVVETMGLRGTAACLIAGITYKQLDYWARVKLITPSIQTPAGQRFYSVHDVLMLRIVKRLLDTGISLQNIRCALDHLRHRSVDALNDVTLFSDGTTVYECSSPQEIVDLLQGGRGVFGIAVRGAIQEITTALEQNPGEPVTATAESIEPYLQDCHSSADADETGSTGLLIRTSSSDTGPSSSFGSAGKKNAANILAPQRGGFSTLSNPDEVRQQVNRLMLPHRFELPGYDRLPDLRWLDGELEVKDFAIADMIYEADVRLDSDLLESFLAIYVADDGKDAFRRGSELIHSSPDGTSVRSPAEPGGFQLAAESSAYCVGMDKSALGSLSDMWEYSPKESIELYVGLDVAAAFARDCCELAKDLLTDEEDMDSLLSHRRFLYEIEQRLIMALLMAQPQTHTAALREPGGTDPHRAIKQAVEVMESHPEWPHTASSLAREANVNGRALHRDFMRGVGIGSLQYLRQARLRRVRAELSAARREALYAASQRDGGRFRASNAWQPLVARRQKIHVAVGSM